MKKCHAVLVALLCFTVFTGCYPGNIKLSETDNTVFSDNESASDEEDNSVSVLETNNPKLHMLITEEEIQSVNTTTALTGVTATLHSWNIDAIRQLFSDDIVAEKVIEYSDVGTGYMWDLSDGGQLSCYDGTISYSSEVGSELTSHINDFIEYMTPSRVYLEHSIEELEGFSKDNALNMVQNYLDALKISVEDDPIIYTISGGAYRICYRLQPDGMSISPVEPLYYESNQEIISRGSLTAFVTQDGVQRLECYEYVDLNTDNASEIAICSAEDAVTEVINNLDQIVLSNETYLENIHFSYAMKRTKDAAYEYELIPVWYMGSYTYSEDDDINMVSSSHFVNAATGKER